MLAPRTPLRSEQGETLLELIIAVAIMGIAVAAIVGGIATTVLTSDIHRKQATAGASVRNYAETVERYVAAGNFDATASPDYRPGVVGFSMPGAGYTANLDSVRCWNSASRSFGACSAGNTLQRVALSVSSTDYRVSESVVVMVRQP